MDESTAGGRGGGGDHADTHDTGIDEKISVACEVCLI